MEAVTKHKKIKIPKLLTVSNIISQNVERIPFEGDWYNFIKQPQNRGVWLIWGQSGSGKSSFIMQLARELAKTKKVLYNTLEEDPDDDELIQRQLDFNMYEVKDKFYTQSYNYQQLWQCLENRNPPDVVIIDSLTYFTKDFEDYMRFKKKFRNKIIIFTAHARGEHPKTEIEDRVKYDAKMKIQINGFLATCRGRTASGGTYIIWREGHEALRGKENNH